MQENNNGAAAQILVRDVKTVLADMLIEPVHSNHIRRLQQGSFGEICHVYTIETTPVDSDMNVSPDNLFCFYQKAFAAKILDENVTSSSVVVRLTAVAMYNLALAYHREGIQRGSSKLLYKALSMYSIAMSSLSEGPQNAVDQMLLLAIGNNMGHIHSIHFEAEEAHCWHQVLSGILDAIPVEFYAHFDRDLLSFIVKGRFFAAHELSCAPTA